MPQLKVNQATYDRLKEQDALNSDMIDTIIDRGLNYNQLTPEVTPAFWPMEVKEMRIDPTNLPSMTFTKIHKATVDGRTIENPTWNHLLAQMLTLVVNRTIDLRNLSELGYVRVVRGRKEDQGYNYLSEVDISFQNQAAGAACRVILELAKMLEISVDIEFMWHAKEGASYPGQRGRIYLCSASRDQAQLNFRK